MTAKKNTLEEKLLACASRVLERAGNAPVLVALSGGADSMALAQMLACRAPDRSRIHWVHVHHGLRGDEADADADFVRQAAKSLEVCFHLHRVDTHDRMSSDNASLEMAARSLRYEVLEGVAAETGAAVIATAHTLDDQVETVLMKWARGAAPGALAGMKPVAPRSGYLLMRPLLSCRRAALREWLELRGLTWREDSSNQNENILRNRLRTRLLPAMTEVFGEGWMDQLARQSRIQAEEDEWMENQVVQWIESGLETPRINIQRLTAEAPAFQRRILHHWMLQQADLPLQQVRWEQLANLLASAEGSSGVDMENGWRLERVYNELMLVRAGAGDAQSDGLLPVPGEVEWGSAGYQLRAEPDTGFIPSSHASPGSASVGYVDASKVSAPLRIRSWREGDRFAVPGMEGQHRKLQDVFTDCKVPRHQRNDIPLVCFGDEIIWIPGFSVHANWLVPNKQASSIRLELRRV